MLVELTKYFLQSGFKISNILLLARFRNLIEEFRTRKVENYYNLIIKQLSETYKKDPVEVNRFINEWINIRPLKYLINQCSPQIKNAILYLDSKKIEWTFYSDHYPNDKLKTLGIDYATAFYSAMPGINCLKPNPEAVEIILAQYKISNKEAVIVGDRKEVDGRLAANAGTYFVRYRASKKSDNLLKDIRLLVDSPRDLKNL